VCLQNPIAIAWAASALAFALAFVSWAFITVKLENAPPPLKGYFLLGLFAFGIGLIVQFVYGSLLYIVLKRLDWISLPIVLLAYLAPVIAFSWHASETTNDIVGTIPWLVFALIVGFVSWFFAAMAGINAQS
jgi:hypothetical protein